MRHAQAKAGARLDEGAHRLTTDKRRVLDAARARSFAPREVIVAELGLAAHVVLGLLNSGLEKVDAFYAEQDSAKAAREGRLQ